MVLLCVITVFDLKPRRLVPPSLELEAVPRYLGITMVYTAVCIRYSSTKFSSPTSKFSTRTLRQHVHNSGAESGVSGRRMLLGALARALGVLHLAHWP